MIFYMNRISQSNLLYLQTNTKEETTVPAETENETEEEDGGKQQPAASNPLNKFIRKPGAKQTTTLDHSVMNRAVRTFNKLKTFRPEDTEGIR